MECRANLEGARRAVPVGAPPRSICARMRDRGGGEGRRHDDPVSLLTPSQGHVHDSRARRSRPRGRSRSMAATATSVRKRHGAIVRDERISLITKAKTGAGRWT